MKARNLRPENDENENRHDSSSDLQNVFVKVKINFATFNSVDAFNTAFQIPRDILLNFQMKKLKSFLMKRSS